MKMEKEKGGDPGEERRGGTGRGPEYGGGETTGGMKDDGMKDGEGEGGVAAVEGEDDGAEGLELGKE